MSDDRQVRIALDVHAHLAPIILDRLATLDGAAWDADAMRLMLDGHAIGPPSLFKPTALIGWMDENGVEQAWISIPPPLYRQSLTPSEARRWCDYVNAGLVTISDPHAERIAALHHLPLEHPELAQEIAADWIARGARRFAAAAGVPHGLTLSDERYHQLWETLEARACFLFLHPATCADRRLAAFYLENLLGNPHETAVAVAHLVFGGVCERFPRIRFCLAHGGGTTAILAGRWQRGFDTRRPGVDTARTAPRELLRRLMVDSIVHDADTLALALAVFGRDRIVFGSDWPFPMGLPQPKAQLVNMPSRTLEMILRTNGEALKSL